MLYQGYTKHHTNDVVDKSEVFKITNDSLHYFSARKLKKKFLMMNKSKNSYLVKKCRPNAWRENFSNNKVPKFRLERQLSYVEEKVLRVMYQIVARFQEKQTCLRSPISVKVQMTSFLYYISD